MKMEMRQENLPIIIQSIEEVKIVIEYKNYLTAEQLSSFYSGLNAILQFYKINDAQINVEKGSLVTKIKFFGGGVFVGALGTILIQSFLSPNKEFLKPIVGITNSFNHSNFSLFSINNITVYNQDNIAQKSKEFDEALLKEADTIEEVENIAKT
jgi:hypothetical protein